MRVRIPAGVRIDGQGMGGRFISLDMLPVIADETDDTGRVLLLDLAAQELDRAHDAVARLTNKYLDDPRRYYKRLEEAESLEKFYESVVEDATTKLVGRIPRKRKAKGKRAPKRPDYTTAGVSEEVVEDESLEWECGVDYKASAGAGSNIDINVRVRRADGQPFGFREARGVLAQLRANLAKGKDNPIPDGYRMAAINWRHPGRGASRGWKHGTKRDLENFQLLLSVAAEDERAWRVGSVE